MNLNLTEIENYLFEQASDIKPNCIFILGSPRTGSTILYQTLLKIHQFGFISNLTNESFYETPSIGFSIHVANSNRQVISHHSNFGKTKGLFQPSEGSYLMRKWFGGEHPSQLNSIKILPNQKEHFIKTIQYANFVFNAPMIIKNAWNCFRIGELARLFPNALFIWIRRDIVASAKSDLNARLVVQKNPNVWNSATPWNVEQLKERPYWEQVLENQYEFNRTLANDLEEYAKNRYVPIWYEDFCKQPTLESMKIINNCSFINNLQSGSLSNDFKIISSEEKYILSERETFLLEQYAQENQERLNFMRYNT
ncbi:sulfotransferase [Legionella spiritensis]|uniref:sulfotransferase n=1 Tax=Legionella spiritensis TaxID=452 RepID=UPI000F7036A9|nr:sulfotransferase [Legionella spiritensis]VEG89664.1 Uncharacterised protein [Legionella spiritensis]